MKRYSDPGRARFLTFSCQKRLPSLKQESCRDIAAACLLEAAEKTGNDLPAWVIMPNHLHLILHNNLGEDTVTSMLASFKIRTARAILPVIRESSPKLFQLSLDTSGKPRLWLRGGGYDRILVSGQEVEEKIAYIIKNPVRMGLCLHPEEYPWSSAFQYKPNDHLFFAEPMD